MSAKLLIGGLALLMAASPAPACSRVFWNTDAKLVGRNMDWPEDTAAKLWFFPVGKTRSGLSNDGNPLPEWTSKYSSVGISFYDKGITDGMNNQGLVVNALWLDEADYGRRIGTVPGLSISLWTQYLLDNCASVEEVVKVSETIDGRLPKFQIVPFRLGGKPLNVHIAVADKHGDTAVIEYVAGRANVYHDRQYTVMTNSPPYPEQLENIKKYQGLGGGEPLPGSSQSKDRFVRAAYAGQRLPQPETPREAVAGIRSVMHYVAQPISSTTDRSVYNSQTRWTSIADIEHLTYFVEMARNPNMISVSLGQMNPNGHEGVFDMTANPDTAGSVNDQLRKSLGARLHFEPGDPLDCAK